MNIPPSRREEYLGSLPQRPYCTNQLGRRLLILDRSRAADFSMIQHNSPMFWHWLVFDVDADDAFMRAEDRGCPPPTFISLNRENGHGHLAYRLEAPVSDFSSSSRRAIKFCEDVERGLTHRLGADPAYPGFLSKNPLSNRWDTVWLAQRPYQLATLNDCLEPADKRKLPSQERTGIGRNVAVFDALRNLAYRQCLRFKRDGKHVEQFQDFLLDQAKALNSAFPVPLSHPEIKGIARSVARWVWSEFSGARFAAIQRAKALKRWQGVSTLAKTRPWEALGVSRATWYRRHTEQPPNPLIS
jgi:hypothetical protein